MKFTTNNLEERVKELCKVYDFFLLDLDNTLYDETKYLYPAYRSIAKSVAAKYSLDENEIGNFLVLGFERQGREKLLNKLIEKFGIPSKSMQEMLSLMRALRLERKIELYSFVQPFLDVLLHQNKKVFIVTNGNLQQQQNKVSLLDWGSYQSNITFIYTALHQPKPDKATFNFLVKEFGVRPERSIMIGDGAVDEEFARNSGIEFIPVIDLLEADSV